MEETAVMKNSTFFSKSHFYRQCKVKRYLTTAPMLASQIWMIVKSFEDSLK